MRAVMIHRTRLRVPRPSLYLSSSSSTKSPRLALASARSTPGGRTISPGGSDTSDHDGAPRLPSASFSSASISTPRFFQYFVRHDVKALRSILDGRSRNLCRVPCSTRW